MTREEKIEAWKRVRAMLATYAPGELAALDYDVGGVCCVVSVLVPETIDAPRPEGMSRSICPKIEQLRDVPVVRDAVARVGLTIKELDSLQEFNDTTYSGYNDKVSRVARYNLMLSHIDYRIRTLEKQAAEALT